MFSCTDQTLQESCKKALSWFLRFQTSPLSFFFLYFYVQVALFRCIFAHWLMARLELHLIFNYWLILFQLKLLLSCWYFELCWWIWMVAIWPPPLTPSPSSCLPPRWIFGWRLLFSDTLPRALPPKDRGLFDPARWTGKTDDLSLRSFLPFLRTQTWNIKKKKKTNKKKKKKKRKKMGEEYKMQDEKTRQFWNLRRA